MWGNRRHSARAIDSLTMRRRTSLATSARTRPAERLLVACTKTTVIWGDAQVSR
jgi:hypothetical protein